MALQPDLSFFSQGAKVFINTSQDVQAWLNKQAMSIGDLFRKLHSDIEEAKGTINYLPLYLLWNFNFTRHTMLYKDINLRAEYDLNFLTEAHSGFYSISPL